MCVDPTFSYHGFHAATPCWNQTCRFISRRVQSRITHCSQGVAANNVGDVVQMLEAFCLFMRGTNMHHVVARIKERQERMLFEDAALHLLMPGNGFKKFICFNADAAGRWQRVPVHRFPNSNPCCCYHAWFCQCDILNKRDYDCVFIQTFAYLCLPTAETLQISQVFLILPILLLYW